MAIRYLDEEPQTKTSIKYIDEQPVVPAIPERPNLLGEALGFLGGSASDIGKRLGNIYESYKATDFALPNPFNPSSTPEEKQSVPSFLLQTVGQGFGGVGDVLGNLAKAAYHQTFSPQSQEQIASSVGGAVSDFSQAPVGQYLGSKVQDYKKFEEANPVAGRNVAALGNIAAIAPLGKTTTKAGIGLKEAANVYKTKVDGIIKQADKMDSAAIKSLSQDAFKEAADLGGQFSPKVTDDIIEYGAKELTALEPTARKFSKNISDKLGLNYVDDVLQSFKDIKGQNVNLNAYNQIDEMMTNLLQHKDLRDELGRLNGAGQKIKGLQEKLRDRVLDASSSDIIGGTQGFESLAKARELWSKQLKMRDLEEMIGRSLNTKQPNYALKKNFGDLLNRIETRGKTGFRYSKEEVDIIRKVAESGRVSELLNLFGSRLPSAISAGTGNYGTAMLLRGASELPRGISTNMQLGQTQKLLNTIAGVPAERAGAGMARMGASGVLNAPGAALNVLGTGLQKRAPQFTTLGLLQNIPEQKQEK